MRYHNILHDDMLNGDGLRVVLFVAGCNHECKECQNPETWNIHGGIPFDKSAKQEIFKQLDENYISGITFSGGDPLHPINRTDILNLCKEIKENYPNKTIWLYTGYTYEEVQSLEILQYVDVLVDGPFEIKKKSPSIPWVGSSNQRVIHLEDGKISSIDENIVTDKTTQSMQKSDSSCTF